MSQNCFWFRTSSSAKNRCAQARQKFWIRLEKWGEISGTRFARPTFWLWKSRWVLFWCLYCTKLEPIFKTNDSEKAPRTGEYASNSERKNTPCISDLAVGEFLLKKERVFFFRGSALQVFGQCVGLQYGFGKTKICFSGGKDFPFCLDWFSARRGLGRNAGGFRNSFFEKFWMGFLS